MTLQELRYTLRNLRQSPGFAIAAVLTLSLAIGGNAAIFILIDAVRLRTLPVQKPRELALIQIRGGNGVAFVGDNQFHLTNPLFQEIRDHQQAFSGVFAWAGDLMPVGMGMRAHLSRGLVVSGNFFDELGVRPVAGRLLAPDDDRPGCPAPGVVLSYGMWQNEFGGQGSAIGKRLVVLGHPYEVIGVTGPEFFGLQVGKNFAFALPLCAEAILEPAANPLSRRDVFWLTVMGRLKPGFGFAQASDHLRAISPGLVEATTPQGYEQEITEKYRQFRLEAVSAAAGISQLRDDYQTPLGLLLALTAIVLLIACCNIANLMLARASAREREMAVRLALGAPRGRLLRQSFFESGVIAFAGAVVGILIAQALSRAIVAFLSTSNDPVFLNLNLDWRVVVFTAAVALGACFVFGIAPAFRVFRNEPAVALQSAGRATAGQYSFSAQRALLAGQISLSCVLLMGSLLFVHSFRNLMILDPGVRRDGVLLAYFDLSPLGLPKGAVKPMQREFIEQIRALPGVQTAAATSNPLLTGGSWTLFVQSAKLKQDSRFTWVSPGYFETLGVPILSGRDFDEGDRENAPRVAIVNQTFARRFFPDVNPIGQTFRSIAEPNFPSTEYQIVGISRDTKYNDLRDPIPAIVYAPAPQYPGPEAELNMYVWSAAPLDRTASAIRRWVAGAHPLVMAQVNPYWEDIQRSVARDRLMAALSSFFGLLAMILAAIGLYGVIAYIVVRRRNEIGIRMALGAGRKRVIAMVMRDVLMLLAIGVGIGTGGALAAPHAAESLLFGVSAHDPAVLAEAIALIAVVSALAGFLPARRASRLDPMAALRHE
ncbi:MAG: ABC transporter permease [Bryobacterales bacterium]|nr:ABC transporter permease [Bryobacterales bacterium]MBV9398059.1 ABC transporter permease [Bryobacterales bacterium]